MKRTESATPELPILSKAVLEQERKMLLDLGHDISSVRDRDDLLFLFSRRLKSLFYFTHTIVTLIDPGEETYTPFLLDHENSPIRNHPLYQQLVHSHFPLNEPFIQAALASEDPVSFRLEEIVDEPQSPVFLRVNYEEGVREILITRLIREGKPMGFVHIHSDQPGSCTPEFRSVIKGIAPQLSGCVANIIKNEEIVNQERERSFLLDFSSDIAKVRTKHDLAVAVRTSLNKLNALKGYAIRKINEDGSGLSAYIYDPGNSRPDKSDLDRLVTTSIPINDGLQKRVLDSEIPVLFDVDREIHRGLSSPYLQYWKRVGYKTTVGIRLRNAGINLGILWLGTEEVNISLLQGICSQISVAMANIMANEQVTKKQEEQAFLLDFSSDMTQVRTRAELQEAIFRVIDGTLHTKLAMIRVIDDDGIHLNPFMSDRTLFKQAGTNYDKMSVNRITIDEPYTSRVLASRDGLVFNVDEEIKDGNGYARLWKTTGLKNMYGLPLRASDKNIGTIWLLADRLSKLMVRGICSQISIAIANIQANEKLLAYKQQLEVENSYLKEQINNFSEIIGSGPAMADVYRLMSVVASTNSTVLVLGETGTGKELIARAIHNASPRKDKLMVKVNCAALPANLIESELFGHEKGAFTGAIDRRIGKFELANHSTLFLDEIGEMPPEAQVKLLRVLQEREIERLGGKQTIKVDVRLIAATNRNLDQEVKAGRFREDLFYRLNVFPIHLPPLRDRPEDIESLANFFVAKYSRNSGRNIKKISPKVLHQLRSYTWPGNVRELEHLIERSILLTFGDTLTEVHIPKGGGLEVQGAAQLANRSLEEVERSYIIEVLQRCGGKISGAGGAAGILQIPGNTLHSKMKKLGISKADYFPVG
ncbi:MAG TPA: sigma 54-interacting transcriptional regulator [Puia sp.]|uniref:sigma-54-dependent Fis family transcriptional regulator n=1 Tax=Puia sp. TaxID=2045100 RepID=UPI002B9AFFF2|nr:sigma 54-interacting transcriptional regulator [Puia sp.]HVU97667.1 sigma 54-interacting transcriptional regulator [Puia sp.]